MEEVIREHVTVQDYWGGISGVSSFIIYSNYTVT